MEAEWPAFSVNRCPFVEPRMTKRIWPSSERNCDPGVARVALWSFTTKTANCPYFLSLWRSMTSPVSFTSIVTGVPAAISLNMRLSGLSLKFFSPPDVESVI